MPIVVRNDVDPALAGYFSILAGEEERRRAEEAQSMRDAQLAEQQRQFDARQGLDEQQFGAAHDQQLWGRGFADRQLASRDRAAMADLYGQQLRGQSRLQEIGLQGEIQRGLQGDQLGARLAEEQMQQGGLQNRTMERLAAQIGQQRLTQILKARDADLHAIRSAELSDEQYADAMSQFEQKYSNLGIPDPVNLPNLADQHPSDNFDPESILEQRKQEFPDVPWQIHPDGSVGPPKNWKPEYDPKVRAEKRQQVEDDVEDKRKQHEADLAIKAHEKEEQRQQRETDARFGAREAKHKARMPKPAQFKKKQKAGEGDNATEIEVEDTDAYNAAMDKWESEYDALIDKYYPSGPVVGGDQPIPVTSPEDIKSKVPLHGKYSVNGVVFTRTK